MNRDEYLNGKQWRVGRKLGRTIYAQIRAGQADDADTLIGMMDTPELAHQVVHDHNRHLMG